MSYLFTPITIRGETIRNRIFVSPMCQYSVDNMDGVPSDWHFVHLGTRAVGGAGLVMAEASSVSPEGRISPYDLGIWSTKQAEKFERITNFITSQGATPAIQLAHAGRKASHDRPWKNREMLLPEEDGWETFAPSPIAFDADSLVPNEMSLEDIDHIISSFGNSALYSVEAGFKVLELHFAHGYLINQFLSPTSNFRDDEYGGDFKRRCKFALEIVETIRNIIPESMPLIVRISSSEYVDGGWDIEDSIEFSKMLKTLGVDMIDCSSGGNSNDQIIDSYPGYQVPFANVIRHSSSILTGSVGLITEPVQSEQILKNGESDVIFLGRELLRNPYWPMQAQVILDQQDSIWPLQYIRSRN